MDLILLLGFCAVVVVFLPALVGFLFEGLELELDVVDLREGE